ncbi:MFS transporter [Lactobacillus delbrueckii]|uniref:MFS transporter n=1 Tax=Lactobacillus delbrueckii TaxID=1584 RepID=UPI0019D234B4|nr:MFS transporter [Lactobacillus delbrueckii]MBN6090879.1 MFS transporter [Lactobacillus delbrueckii subsp. bulgaricus]
MSSKSASVSPAKAGRMEKEKGKSIYSKDVILVMTASFLFLFGTMFNNPLINGYAESLGASSILAGVIVGIMSFAAMFLRPIAGNLTDKFSKYQLSFIGGVLILIGIVGYIISPNGELLLLFRIINGTGFVLCTVCMTTWIAFLVPRQHVGAAMGLYGLMNALAMSIAPAISINLYKVIGYRETMMLPAAATLIMIIIIQFVGNRAVPSPRQKEKKQFKLVSVNALPVALLTTCFGIPYFVTQADIVTYVAKMHMPVAVGSYFFIYAIVLLLIRTFLKNYFDTVRFGVWFWLSLVVTAIYLVLLAYMNSNWMMALGAAGMAVGYGLIYSVLQSTALLLSPANEQGLGSSTFYLGLDIAMAFGPMLAGVVAKVLPGRWFYLVQLIVVPLALIVYLVWRKRLNGAIDNH